MKTTDYMMIPIQQGGRSRDGVDCWGLVRLIYKDHYDIVLPSYDEVDWTKGDQACLTTAHAERDDSWQEISAIERREGDVCVLRVQGYPWHLGVLSTPDKFIHADPTRGVCVERLDAIHWKNRVSAYFRHSALAS